MRAVAEAGYDAALIGEALVTADDPADLLRTLRADASAAARNGGARR